MLLDLGPQELEAQESPNQTVAIMAELAYRHGPVRFWTGIGTLEYEGVEWTGAGALASITQLNAAGDGRANAVVLGLSGIPIMFEQMNLAAYVDEYAKRGAPARVLFPKFDASGQVIRRPHPLYVGLVDAPSINMGAETFSVNVTLETLRARAQQRSGLRLDHKTLQALRPGERGGEYIPDLQNKSVN